MDSIVQFVETFNLMSEAATPVDANSAASSGVYPASIHKLGAAIVMMVRLPAGESAVPAVSGPAGATGGSQRRLLVVSAEKPAFGFHGPIHRTGRLFIQEALPAPFNLGPLWEHFPWTRPVSLRDRPTTIGLGDRNGLATPGHIRVAREFGFAPVLAQQSIRELAFTGRSFADVVTDAAFHVFAEGYDSGYGADGDHLKTIPDIDRALEWGMPMVTLDLTDVMHPEVAEWSDTQVEAGFSRLPSNLREHVERDYCGRTLSVGSGSIPYVPLLAKRCAVMYVDALEHSVSVNRHLDRMTGGAFDLEISVDETTTPTLPSHHLFIARELERRDVKVSSLAPRFIGEFQKGIDYIGDTDEFDRQFSVHAEIARSAGGYKLSIHSGSDKFTVYPTIGRESRHRVHLKTAGTNWLESLRTIARAEPDLYRVIHERAFEYFPEASKSYHIGADLDAVKPVGDVHDNDLPLYLEDSNCRQLLHISYGGLLRDPVIHDRYFEALHRHAEAHAVSIAAHIGRHVQALGLERGVE